MTVLSQISNGSPGLDARETINMLLAKDGRVLERQMAKWQIALAGVIAGKSHAKVAWVGDSLTEGFGAPGGGVNETGAAALTTSVAIKRLFPVGVPVINSNFFGDHGVGGAAGVAGVTQYDPRITFAGSSWVRQGDYSLGGTLFYNASGTDALTFNAVGLDPGLLVDTIEIYVFGGGSCTFTVTDSTGTLATLNTGAPSVFQKFVVTRTASANPISVQRTGGGGLYIAGMDCYNSAIKAIRSINLGISGVASTNAASTTAFGQATALRVLAPDLTIPNLGTNDVRIGLAVASGMTAQQTLIDAGKASGSVLLVGPWADYQSNNPTLTQPYRDARAALAAANDIPYCDLSGRFGSSIADPRFVFYSDGKVHLLAAGYADVAQAINPFIRPQ